MKWRGQGVLTVMVVVCAGAIAAQWYSVTGLVDDIEGHGLRVDSYIGPVALFVDEKKRFPQPGEVTLSAPPEGDVIRSVVLGSKGTLTFKLSTWTIFDGHVSFTMAPEVNTGALLPPVNRLHYSCVEAHPNRFASVVCQGVTTQEAIDAGNQKAFAEWAADRDRLNQDAAAKRSVQNVATECDRLATLAREQVVPCIAQVDPKMGEQFTRMIVEHFENHRLNPEVIARIPEVLDALNRECSTEWHQVAAQVRAGSKQLEHCFALE